MKRTLAVAVTLCLLSPVLASAQAHDRREAAIASSSQVQAVQGGTTIQVDGAYDKVFDGLVTYLQKSGYSVESAAKESGLVATSLEITGGWKQTGKRLVISVIKNSATTTSLRVAVTLQKRYKGMQTEPWSDPKVDDKASASTAEKIKAELPNQLSQSSGLSFTFFSTGSPVHLGGPLGNI